MSDYDACADCTVTCGNRDHPDGPWHVAEPMAASWEWGKTIVHWWRTKKWGCNCPATGIKAQRIDRRSNYGR